MFDASFWIGIARQKSFVAISAAAIASAAVCFDQAAAEQSPLSLLREPPKLNYSRICKPPLEPLPMARDWTLWDGTDSDVPADRILSDAARLAEGDNEVNRDRLIARKLLTYLASGASTSAAEAKTRLAALLLDPRSGPTDAHRAKRLLTEATASQQTSAALSMGKLIREGRLPGATIDDAIRYLSIAAGRGDATAALQLAAIYVLPGASNPFPGAAAHFSTLAAINVQTSLVSGDCGIAVDVGEYLIDTNPQEGMALAASWFEVAADAGDVRALARLARIYETGEGREKDLAKARDLWDRAAAGGLVRAFAPAAKLRIAAGDDLPTAIELLHSAMDNGDPDGYLMAARYYRGDYTGKPDFDAMQKVLHAAVGQPDASFFTMEVLANAYLAGQGVSVDAEQAHEIYLGILKTGLPDGEALYGRYLVNNGLGLNDGIKHLENAASKGSQVAKFQQAEIAFCSATDDSERLLTEAAETGSFAAMRRLARLATDRGDQSKAIELWHRAADLGDRLAMVELAVLSTSDAVPGVDAASLVKRAAAPGPGVIDGRLALAIAHKSGRLGGAPADADDLLTSLSESRRADVDVEIAKRDLAVASGADLSAITERLKTAAEAGNAEAMLLLARLSEPAAPGSASGDWLVRAAERGESEALAALLTNDPRTLGRVLASLKERVICNVPGLVQEARLYRLNGDTSGADRVMQQAERLAALRPRDMHILAEAFASQGPGAADNPSKAAALFEKSATAGHGKSALALASLYASGRVGQRYPDAIKWYRQAVFAGESSGLRELVRYASAGSDQPTAGLAMTALQEIAERGDAAAMQAYGSLLATLNPEGYAEGMVYLKKAADKGDIQAMKTLARFFAAGLNGAISAEESTRWTRLAAENGDPEAMFQYAIALDLGFGVAVDRSLAQTWQQKARQNGYVR